MLIEPKRSGISISRQCELLDLSRSSYYYRSAQENEYNLLLMRLIDEQFTTTPFYGVRRMTAWLKRYGHQVNPKWVRRLMRIMGIEAVYPKPRPSKASKEYPYLLKVLTIDRPNHVWSTDITFYKNAPRLCLSRGHPQHGLVQPVCTLLGAF